MNLEFIRQLIESWGYLIVFCGIALESSGIPFPGETVLLVAAALAATSTRMHIEWVILWAVIGAIFGDNCGYWAGRKLGKPLLERVGPLLHFDAHKRKRLEDFFARHGAKTIFIARFVALLRAWAAFFAGLNHMPYPTFLLYNALGGLVWAVAVGLLGYLFGQNLALLEHYLGDFSYAVLALVLLGGLIFFFVRRQRKPTKLAD